MSRRTLVTTSVLVVVALVYIFAMVRTTAAHNLKATADEVLGLEFLTAAADMCLESAREETRVHSSDASVYSQTFDPDDGHVVVIKVKDVIEDEYAGEQESLMNPRPRNRPTEYFKCVFAAEPRMANLTQVRG